MGFVAQLVDPRIIGKMGRAGLKSSLDAVLKRNKDIGTAIAALKKKEDWRNQTVELIKRNTAVHLSLIDEIMRRRKKP